VKMTSKQTTVGHVHIRYIWSTSCGENGSNENKY